ncbi:MAG TPA: DUF4159 domain-containing protein [Pirellulales bacterium]|jgi:hypothetical protein|nr:DUF4159 domain-containing protein [Pirellulales bacterium]
MRSRSCRRFSGLVCLAALLAASPAHGEITAEKVREAIEHGVAYLEREQGEDGHWIDPVGYPGGITSLCTLALLNCGVPPQDKHVQSAVNYLRKIKPQRTYSTALQTMVFCAAEPGTNLALIKRNAQWLEDNQKRTGQMTGAWAYPEAEGDNSNSQFALLALHEAERVGVKVSDRTWELAHKYWLDCQNPNGSWGYKPGTAGTGSMTCAGIAALVITSDRLNHGDAEADGDQISCCGQQKDNAPLDRALNWMGRNFSVHTNPGIRGATQGWLYYYLYGVERTGRLTNQRLLGGHDWYREGAELLVNLQDGLSGYWKGTGHAEDDPHLGTSLALLFLAKGRRPVLCAKLKHEPLDDWNNHRSDLGNLTSYVETHWQRDLTWQVIDAGTANTEDLLESPVLYLCGSSAPKFTDEQVERLRVYINQGGFILAEANCEGSDFEKGFEQLVRRMFPEPEYRLHDLALDHPAYTAEERVDTSVFRIDRLLKGIDVGCRTSVIYVPHELRLSCLWELARPGREGKYSPKVQAQIEAARSLGTNILAYATNREVRYKLDVGGREIASTQAIDPFERLKIYIGKVQYGGSWNAAPGALMNLLQVVSHETGMRVNIDQRAVPLAGPKIFEYQILYLHGRNAFGLDEEERKQLKLYVERGGVVLADAVCGSDAFVKAFRREISETFGKPLEPIAVSHPLFSSNFGGFDIKTVRRREPHRRGDGPLKASVAEVPPDLEGLKLDGRYGVIFSPLDISCALERHESLECPGYIREDAARIGLNLVLYAMEQ